MIETKNKSELIYHLKRMITCLGEHLENEAKRNKITAKELCPCLTELKVAQKIVAEIEGGN